MAKDPDEIALRESQAVDLLLRKSRDAVEFVEIPPDEMTLRRLAAAAQLFGADGKIPALLSEDAPMEARYIVIRVRDVPYLAAFLCELFARECCG